MNLIKKVFNSEIRGIDEKTMELTAVVSTAAVDRYKEVIDPDGMDAKNFRKNPVVLWAHDYSQPPIGKALWIKKEGEGIVSKVKFANTPRGQEIFNLYKDGFMKAFSIGFIPVEVENGDFEKPNMPRKRFKKWELLEYSAVPIPANPEALTLCIQKGIISADEQDKIEEKGFEDIDQWNEEEKKELPKGEEKTGARGLDEVLAVVDDLESKVKGLTDIIKQKDAEIQELSLAVINQQKHINTLQENPGITASELGEKIVEVASGVIRKHLGKVE